MLHLRHPSGLLTRIGFIFCFGVWLAACGQVEAVYPNVSQAANEETGSVLDLFDEDTAENSAAKAQNPKDPKNKARGLAVNADLWRAALDTLSFVPLASSDPIGGVIISDWYNDPQTPSERFKINAVIVGLELRADAVRVSMFRERQVNGHWISIAATPRTARQLENIILSRARAYRMARLGG